MKAKNLAKILSAFLAIALVVTLGIALRPDTAAKAVTETVTTTFDDAADIAAGKAVEVWLNAYDDAVTDPDALRGSEDNPYALVREIIDGALCEQTVVNGVTVSGDNFLATIPNADFAKLERIIIHVTGDAFNYYPGVAANTLGGDDQSSFDYASIVNTSHARYVVGGSASKILLDFQGVQIGSSYPSIYYQASGKDFYINNNVRFSNLYFNYLPDTGIDDAGALPTENGDEYLSGLGNDETTAHTVSNLWVGSDVAIFGQNFQFYGASVTAAGIVTDNTAVDVWGSTPAQVLNDGTFETKIKEYAIGSTNHVSSNNKILNITTANDFETAPERLVSTTKEFAIQSGTYNKVYAFGVGNYVYSAAKHVFDAKNCTFNELVAFSLTAQSLADASGNRNKITFNLENVTIGVVFGQYPIKDTTAGTSSSVATNAVAYYGYTTSEGPHFWPSAEIFAPKYDFEINISGENTQIGEADQACSGVFLTLSPWGTGHNIRRGGTTSGQLTFMLSVFYEGNVTVNLSDGKVSQVSLPNSTSANEQYATYTGKAAFNMTGGTVSNYVAGPWCLITGANTSYEFNISGGTVGLDETQDYDYTKEAYGSKARFAHVELAQNVATQAYGAMKKGVIACFSAKPAQGAVRQYPSTSTTYAILPGVTPAVASGKAMTAAVNISGTAEVYSVTGLHGAGSTNGSYLNSSDVEINIIGGTVRYYIAGTCPGNTGIATAIEKALTVTINVKGGTVGFDNDNKLVGAASSNTARVLSGINACSGLYANAAGRNSKFIVNVTGGTLKNISGAAFMLAGDSTWTTGDVDLNINSDDAKTTVNSITLLGGAASNAGKAAFNKTFNITSNTSSRAIGKVTLNLGGSKTSGKTTSVTSVFMTGGWFAGTASEVEMNVGRADDVTHPSITSAFYGSTNIGGLTGTVTNATIKFKDPQRVAAFSLAQGGYDTSHNLKITNADVTIDGGTFSTINLLISNSTGYANSLVSGNSVEKLTFKVGGGAKISHLYGMSDSGRAGEYKWELGKATYPDTIYVVNFDLKSSKALDSTITAMPDRYRLAKLEITVKDPSVNTSRILVPDCNPDLAGSTTTPLDFTITDESGIIWSQTATEESQQTAKEQTFGTEDYVENKGYLVYTSPVANFTASTVVFGSTFKARILVPKADYDAYVSAGYSLKSVTAGTNDVTADFQASLAAPYNGQYYFVLISGVAAKDIGTAVPMTLTLEKAGSDDYVATWNDYSLEAALKTVAAYTDPADAKFATAAKATLAYCQAAADQFGVTAAYAAGEVTHVTSDTEINEYFDTTDGDVKFVGTNLVLKEELAIKFWADASGFAGSISDVTVKINGVDKTASVEAAVNGGSKGYWTFKVAVPISEMDDNMTIELFVGANRISNAYTDSVLNYGVSCQNPAYNMSQQDKTTGQAVIDYVHYVNDYLASIA